MEKKNEIRHSQKFLKQRKFLLLLPLLVLPFLTFVGYSAGIIGKDAPAKQVEQRGFNAKLPDAAPSADSNWNKLAFYEKADKDSALRRAGERADPYRINDNQQAVRQDTGSSSTSRYKYEPYPNTSSSPLESAAVDANEQRVYKKLAELDNELNRRQRPATLVDQAAPTTSNADVDRLERMMASVSADNGGNEFSQINGVLERILDVQHPERVREKLKERSFEHKTSVFPVTAYPSENGVSLLSNVAPSDTVGLLRTENARFYGLEDGRKQISDQRSIRAIVPEFQTLVSGTTIKLMLTDDVYIRGELIPRHTFVYGVASIDGDRMRIAIASLKYEGNIYPVSLSAYDLDGLEGIYVPGSINREVSKQTADQAIQNLGIASLDPSLGAQAASAGLQAAKTLVGRKARLVRVNVPGNYEVLLMDANGRER
ncbi:conjugative transposon protein TraM [Paraflavitalea pollutisoli]|uniref:conjugative transposon protein TraM n=1 Tax=Paraflavitalea pollutisoli TaxID=3034143 RepID=UPI0023ED594D|nr:conjugative transposon protein TraM [Paraflavitalea sp. H1-2-19X]